MRTTRFLVLLGTAALLLAAGSAFAANSGIVAISSVEGLIGGDTLTAGQNVRFVFGVNNNTGHKMNMSNGFVFASPDGAQWDSISVDSCGPYVAGESKLAQYFLTACAYYEYTPPGTTLPVDPPNGPGHIAFLGAANNGTHGLPIGYTDTVYAAKIWMPSSTAAANHGKHICIDTQFTLPGNTWVWVDPGPLTNYYPVFADSMPGAPAYVTGVPGVGGYCFTLYNAASGVNERDNGLPHSFAVSQNYPNPFNPTTKINFDVPVKSEVKLSIYNVLGQKVTTLINKAMQPGKYQVDWSGRNDGGSQVASGVYFYKFEAGTFVQVKKMVMLK